MRGVPQRKRDLLCAALSLPPPSVRPSLPPSCPHVPYFLPAARGWLVGEEREEGGFAEGEKESIAEGPGGREILLVEGPETLLRRHPGPPIWREGKGGV